MKKSKDPAFLFYSSDFLTGTMLMSNEQVGMYIRLMCLQHQKGKLTEKDMLNICKTYDEDVFSKFTKDEHGLFYNDRLSHEIQRRMDYTESRRQNRLHKNISTSYVPHMENENENVIRKTTIVKKSKYPTIEEVVDYFIANGYTEESARKAFLYYADNDWKDSKGNQVKAWKQKMVANWFREENKKSVAPVKRMVI